jgi:phage gpG-like protein
MKSLQQFQRDFAASTKEVQKAIKKDLPRLIGIESVKLVKNNFETQSYFGFGHWKKRKPTTNKAYMAGRGKGESGRYKGSRFNANHPLLLQTRRLFRSIRFKVEGNGVFIGSDTTLVPYARTHNEGLTIHQNARKGVKLFFNGKRFSSEAKATHGQKVNIGAHDIKMPKRQFIPAGNDPMPVKIRTMIVKEFNQEFDKALKMFKK